MLSFLHDTQHHATMRCTVLYCTATPLLILSLSNTLDTPLSSLISQRTAPLTLSSSCYLSLPFTYLSLPLILPLSLPLPLILPLPLTLFSSSSSFPPSLFSYIHLTLPHSPSSSFPLETSQGFLACCILYGEIPQFPSLPWHRQ